MSQSNRDYHKTENLAQLTDSFEETVAIVKNFALEEIQTESKQKQLYYHSCNHAYAVQNRADIIFQALEPFAEEISPVSLTRLKHLIDLCAISHDMVQEFLPNTEVHTARKRQPGVSEAATISKLINYIKSSKITANNSETTDHIFFTDIDLQIIKESIQATICLSDSEDNCIYQPYLYSIEKKISLPARIVALADIGSLGIEGIKAYFREGILIFLEENPDIVSILLNEEYKNQPELSEKFRQRLLKRARFQVIFAKARQARFMHEVNGLPEEAIAVLQNQVFKFLNQDTITTIESITPTQDDTIVEDLIEFFDLKRLIKTIFS